MSHKPPMDIYQIVSLLNQENIRVWQEQGQLRYSAKEGAMTDSIKHLLRDNKQALLDFLQQPQATSPIKAVADKPETLDLSYAQQRIWYASNLAGNDNLLLISSAFLLQGPLNLKALVQTSEYLGQFFQAINQRFFATAQGPKQQAITAKHPIKTITGFSDITACLKDAPSHYQFSLELGKLSQTLLYPLSNTQHVIIFALHHIVADAHSMALLAQALSHSYQAFSQGKSPSLPTPKFDYGDYILWQQAQQQSEKIKRQLAFWQQHLQTPPSQCLPIIESLKPPRAKNLSSNIGADFTRELQEFAAKKNCSLFMLLQTLLAASLSIFSEGPTIAIGNPVAGRQEPGLDDIFGCFINLVVWQQSINQQLSFSALLQQCKNTSLKSLANQDVPFEQVVKAVNPERDGLNTPLFQVLFNLQEQQHYQQNLGDLSIKALTLEQNNSPYPLSVDANLLQNGSLQLQWLYRDDLLAQGFIEQLSSTFTTLAKFFIAQPESSIEHFVRQQSNIENWVIQGAQKAIAAKLIGDYIFDSANNQSLQTAVIDQQQEYSYQQLQQHSNALAYSWQQQNFSRVAIYLPEGYLAITAMVAAVKAGISFMPFTYDTGLGFISQCIKQVSVDAIICDTHSDKDFSHTKTEVLNLERLAENSPEPTKTFETNPSFAVLFTSGSSGQPKAVELKQQAVINRLLWMQATFNLKPGERILQKTAYSFDVSLWEIFWPLMFAGTLVCASATQRFDSQQLSQLINQHQIRFCHFVPSMLQQFLQWQTTALPSLEAVIASGEVLDAPLQKRFFEHLPSSKLFNLYGPTEAAIDVSFHRCQPNSLPTLGHAIDNCQIAITNETQQLLPPFAIGQITLAGICLSEGYLNVANDSAFATHQILGRCYYTGDLGFIDKHGLLHFVARADKQLKVRGVRINPEQIEQLLLQKPNIKQAKLLAQQQRLWLFYSGEFYNEQELQSFLQSNLPRLMQPQRICHVEQWPRLKSGKIDEKALIQQNFTDSKREKLPARNNIEEKLQQQWQALLNVDNIGVYDNFFELGGHSLLASQAVYQCQQAFGVSIQLSDIITNPCIATVAKAVEQARHWQAITSAVDNSDDEGEDIVV